MRMKLLSGDPISMEERSLKALVKLHRETQMIDHDCCTHSSEKAAMAFHLSKTRHNSRTKNYFTIHELKSKEKHDLEASYLFLVDP